MGQTKNVESSDFLDHLPEYSSYESEDYDPYLDEQIMPTIHHLYGNVIFAGTSRRKEVPLSKKELRRLYTEPQNSVRHRAHAFLITVAKCSVNAADVLQGFIDDPYIGPKIKIGIAVNEHHKAKEEEDVGECHLHVYLLGKQRFQIQGYEPFTRAIGFVDYLESNYHLNIDVKHVPNDARNLAQCYAYLQKENKPCWYGVSDLDDYITKAGISTDEAKRLIIEYSSNPNSFLSIMRDEQLQPYLVHNTQKVRSYCDARQYAITTHRPEWSLIPPPAPSLEVTAPALMIIQWLNENICLTRRHRQKQLWIYGPPGVGKTHLLGALFERVSTYIWNRDEKYQDGYDDSLFNLIVFDEYVKQDCLRLGHLNTILDGSPCHILRKGSASYLKTKIQPVIICSNYHPSEIYSNVASARNYSYDALLDRLTIVPFFDPVNWSTILSPLPPPNNEI